MPISPSGNWGKLGVIHSILLHGTVIGALLVKLLVLGASLDTAVHPEQRAAIGATLAILLILAAPTTLLPWRLRLAALLSLNVCLTSVALADVLHFRAYGDVISMAEIGHVGQLTTVLTSVLTLLRPTDALFYGDIVVLVVLSLSRPVSPPMWAQSRQRLVGAALLIVGLASMTTPTRLIWDDPEEVFEYATTRREVAVAIGLVPYHLHDLVVHVSYAIVGRLKIDDSDRAAVKRYLVERDEAERSAQSELFGIANDQNLIIVMAESLEDFPIDLAVDGQPVMPALSRFAKESLRFKNFYDQTHLGTTSDGEFTSLQSLHPLPAGVVSTRYATNDYHGLPAILADAGYATFSASGELSDFWNKRQMHPKLGFDRSVFGESYELRETFGLGLTDGEFFRQTMPLLLEHAEPFMAFLLTQSNHHPYSIPLEHRTMTIGHLEGTLLGDYLHSVHYFDTVFGRFVEHLERTGLLERSVVVVYGDHRAFWDEVPGLAALLGDAVSDSTDVQHARTRLPLLIRLPTGAHADVRSVPGGHLDVAPTLLGVLGVDDRSAVMLGRDLLRPRNAPSAVVFRDGGFIDAEYHAARGGLESAGCVAKPARDSIPCESIGDRLTAARTQLEVSDLIIRGDLIPELRADRQRGVLVLDRQPLVVIAHRGHSVAAPENTLAAIDAAFDAGSDVVEIDVRMSRDGVPVVIHDETVDRTTNGTGPVADQTLAELQRLDAGSWKGRQFAGERIPTLEEALRAAKNRGRVLLDVPIANAGPAIARVLRSVKMSPPQVILATWDASQRAAFSRQLPDAVMSLAEGAPRHWDANYFVEQKRRGVSFFEIANWSPSFIAAAHTHAMPVWVYTVNDEDTMRTLIESAVDGIETDDPDLAIRVARELGAR